MQAILGSAAPGSRCTTGSSLLISCLGKAHTEVVKEKHDVLCGLHFLCIGWLALRGYVQPLYFADRVLSNIWVANSLLGHSAPTFAMITSPPPVQVTCLSPKRQCLCWPCLHAKQRTLGWMGEMAISTERVGTGVLPTDSQTNGKRLFALLKEWKDSDPRMHAHSESVSGRFLIFLMFLVRVLRLTTASQEAQSSLAGGSTMGLGNFPFS